VAAAHLVSAAHAWTQFAFVVCAGVLSENSDLSSRLLNVGCIFFRHDGDIRASLVVVDVAVPMGESFGSSRSVVTATRLFLVVVDNAKVSTQKLVIFSYLVTLDPCTF
jgi:hypothetical protein